MKKSTVVLLSGIVAINFSLSALAEMRIWTDETGKTIEAEHVRTLDDKVVLKLVDGSEIKVSLDTLTEKDRKYAILLAPPRVEIKVSVKNERDNKAVGRSNRGPGMQVQQESVQATVDIRKSSSAPYEAPLQSEVYLIGRPEQADYYMILNTSKSKFQFTTENKNEHSYESGMVNLKQLEAGKQAGVEYEGYLAIVRDRNNEIIGMKCSKLVFEKNAEAIVGSKKGEVFDENFESVERKEAKEEARQEAGKENQKKRGFPGRRF